MRSFMFHIHIPSYTAVSTALVNNFEYNKDSNGVLSIFLIHKHKQRIVVFG